MDHQKFLDGLYCGPYLTGLCFTLSDTCIFSLYKLQPVGDKYDECGHRKWIKKSVLSLSIDVVWTAVCVTKSVMVDKAYGDR